SSTSLDKYGQSQNKFFEYLAAGRAIIQTYTTGYSLLEKYNCGFSATDQNPENVAKTILEACKNDEQARQMGENARKAAHEFDFKNLTNKLIEVIENV
ncbi:MAG TPA: glycosyltransferase family 4 protein, partial [Acholeplasma sp.]|nr:glycosyltransferase family 4 protein [Acholeplasma sp.]